MSYILVNATAARISGALSILNQFLDGIKKFDKYNNFVVFVDPSFREIKIENVRYVPINTKGWKKRIQWDEWGVKNWVKSNNVKPCLIISLQNTGVNYLREVPQLVYYHQPLAISSYKWNPFRKDEFLLFCYNKFYRYFVKHYLMKNTQVVVQMPFIKRAFLQTFDISAKNVHVIPPKIEQIDYNMVENKNTEVDNHVQFIYPATGVVYKNHLVLLKALRLLRLEDKILFDKIRLYFTLEKGENRQVDKLIKTWGLENTVVLKGGMLFSELLACYKTMDALLFPSFIETVGLPLLEAAGSGMAIKVSDLPYAHEVLQGYDGVTYIDYQDEHAWAEAIKSICCKRMRYAPMRQGKEIKGWRDFFDLVDMMKLKE